MIKIKNKKTGEIIEIDETNPKLLAKYGIKVPKAQVGASVDNSYFGQNQNPVFGTNWNLDAPAYQQPPQSLQQQNFSMVGDNSLYTPTAPIQMDNMTELKNIQQTPKKATKQPQKAPSVNAITGNKYLDRGLTYTQQGIKHFANINNPNRDTSSDYAGMSTMFPIKAQNGAMTGANVGANTGKGVDDTYFQGAEGVTGEMAGVEGVGGSQQAINALEGALGAVNTLQGGINFTKFGLETIGTNKQNQRAQQLNNQIYTQSVASQATDLKPDDYIFNRQALAENGMKIKEIGGKGVPNIEVEHAEHIKLPNGFSEEISGKTHAEGGIPLSLPANSIILSEKLKVKTPKGKKSYADLAKPFETKKEFELLNSKRGDDIQKSTAEMTIKIKNKKLEEIYNQQEMDKATGIHGLKVQKETLEQIPTMEYGGLMKMQTGGNSWEGQTFKTKEGIITPQGTDLNKNPLTNWEAYRNEWEKIARENGQLKKNERFKATKEMQEFMYDWALDNNPSLIQDMYKTHGITNKGEKSFKPYQDKLAKGEQLSLQELKNLRTNFIDDYRGKRVFSPKVDLSKVPNVKIPNEKEQTTSTPDVKTEIKYLPSKTKLQNLNLSVPIGNNYTQMPLNYYRVNPEYIDPRYLNVQDQLNNITRGERAFKTNIGSRSASDVANLLQAQSNVANSQNSVFANKYNYDRQQDSQAQQFNATSKMNTNNYNQQSWFGQLEDPTRRMLGAIGDQKLTDYYKGLERNDQQLAFQNNKDFIDATFPYYQNLNVSDVKDFFQTQEGRDYFSNLSKETKKAYGGKVKIKPKTKRK